MALNNSIITKLGKYLTDRYYIPNYQREYSWEEVEWNDFWDDLKLLIETGDEKDQHFFGQIVVHDDAEEGKKYIIDGQQRTITSIIFLRAMQLAFADLFKEYSLPDANVYSSTISTYYINDTKGYKLTLGEIDRDYFKDNILSSTIEDCVSDRVRSHERMKRAFKFFSDKLKAEMFINDDEEMPAEDKLNTLINYYDTFVDRFVVLYMEATELSEAFIIFETLNARGRDLETADLLKNFIFSRSKNDIGIAQARWSRMLDNLDKADTTKYIRHYWNSCHYFTREKELYKKISKGITSPKANSELLIDLERIAPYYHDLALPNDDSFAFKNVTLREHLATLKTLKASTYYPIVIAMLKTDGLNGEKDIEKVLRNIVLYVFRNFTICNKVANTAEIFFAKTALDIFEQRLKTVDEIVGTLKKEIVDDDEFTASFMSWTASSSTKEIARYILRNIHRYLDPRSEVIHDNSEVHIEHIMPQDNSKWHVDEEIHSTYLWRLGNLALLSGSKNIALSNNVFEEKKKDYLQSDICPNKEIGKYDVWGEDQINERQAKFAEYAKEIWKK